MNLLIVEDDIYSVQSYQDIIDSYNLDEETISTSVCDNIEKAKDCLKISKFDAVIVDLKLSSSTTKLEGIELVDHIVQNLRIPVFVVSGSIEQFAKEESAFFKKRKRDMDFREILKEILQLYDTGITKILGNEGIIESYLQTIFWNHISNRIDLWSNDITRDKSQKEKSLLRYTLVHMQEYIDEEVEKYHPSEFFIVKPIKKNIFTGDIISSVHKRFLVLTPSCDMVLRQENIRNAEFVFLCRIKDLNEVVKNYDKLESDTAEGNNDRKRLISYIQNKNQRYHFMPKSLDIEAGLIDFQDKISIPSSKLGSFLAEEKMERVATISAPFLKDIISRYSNYYSRQGSPDFNEKEIYSALFPKLAQ